RDFDISACENLGLAQYERLAPFQWPWRKDARDAAAGKRFFANGGFFTPDKRARMIETPYRAPRRAPDASTPFVLNTGRIRDQWHTMTRTGLAPRLASHRPDPFVEVNPDDAVKLGLTEDG